jgi:hypothetical protein
VAPAAHPERTGRGCGGTYHRAGGQGADFARVHLLSTSTVARIAALALTGTAEAARCRPNIVVHTPVATGFTKNDWTGRALRIGADLTLRVMTRMSPRYGSWRSTTGSSRSSRWGRSPAPASTRKCCGRG